VDALAGEEMKFYGNAPHYGLTLPSVFKLTPRRKLATKKSGPRLTGKGVIVSKSLIAGLGDSEGNVEARMMARRSDSYPYFQDKAQDLRTRSIEIDAQLEDIEAAMAPSVSTWLSQLAAARTKIVAIQNRVEGLGKDGYTVLNWILSFGGALPTDVLSPKNEIDSALVTVQTALRDVEAQITLIGAYGGRLAWRQHMGDLNQWAGGTNLKGMAENVCRSLGTTQREMLQGWWSMSPSGRHTGPSTIGQERYNWLATGGIKPWQPVCDLYKHSVDPKSWAAIEHEREMAGGYGTTIGTTGGGSVYFRHPKPGQAGYTGFTGAAKDVWGVSKLEEGCLYNGTCPTAPWLSPVTRTKALIAQQQLGLTLVTSTQINEIIRQINSKLDQAQSKLDRADVKFGRLITVLDSPVVASPIKKTIKTILRSAGSTAAIAGLGAMAGGPIGALAGWFVGEISLSAAVGEIWDRLTAGPRDDRVQTQLTKNQLILQAGPSTRTAFQWWKSNTSLSWRNARKSELQTAKSDLDSWLSEYNGMMSKCRTVYPPRTGSEWQRLGVAEKCSDYRTPEFEMPSGWTPPIDGWTLGPKSEGGGSEMEDPHAWDSGALETAFGSYGGIVGLTDVWTVLTKKKWLLLGVLGAGAFYYTKRKK
tara:strand:- start:144 stop:2075 length:1932 start_codon:yes stop_codon:yes gene_type:complete